MHVSGSEDDDRFLNSPEPITDAVEAWHLACCQAFLENRNGLDRYGAVVDALITWLAENPEAARRYFDVADDSVPTDEMWAAKNRLTRSLVELSRACDGVAHQTEIEFAIGAVRQVVREELRSDVVDHARLAHRLTHFAPLFVGNQCGTRK